jgi:hypothetical protein
MAAGSGSGVMQPPINGTEERLDLILAELRAIRAEKRDDPDTVAEQVCQAIIDALPEKQVELREPLPAGRRKR